MIRDAKADPAHDSPILPDEMRAVVANLTAREWIQNKEQLGDAVCAHGAVMTCQGLRPGDAQIIRAVMRAKGLTEAWNDEDGRTKAQVLKRLSSIAVSDDDLAYTFGPSWRMVVVVIRRAAVMTSEEATNLSAAARVAARVAAWDAAQSAAWDAAWDAWDARVAARVAAWDAAQSAARDAAWAACVHDLIGQHGLTQDHIDTLMGPWVGVLGVDWADAVTS